MAIKKKYLQPQDLTSIETFEIDNRPESVYFNVIDLEETIPGGKTTFQILGSKYLTPEVELKIELIDRNGNPIYIEPIKYLGDTPSRHISVEVYKDTPSGLATLTILGSAERLADGTEIPEEWRGLYNVKWERNVFIDPTLKNTQPILFRGQAIEFRDGDKYPLPSIDVGEQVRGIVVASGSGASETGFVTQSLFTGGNYKANASQFDSPTDIDDAQFETAYGVQFPSPSAPYIPSPTTYAVQTDNLTDGVGTDLGLEDDIVSDDDLYDDLHGTRPPINTPIPPIDDDIPPVDPDEEVRPVSVEPDFAGLGTLIKKSSGADFRSELAGGTFRAVPSVNYDLVKDVKGKGFTSSSFTASVVAVHSPELIELDRPFTIANQEKFPGKNFKVPHSATSFEIDFRPAGQTQNSGSGESTTIFRSFAEITVKNMRTFSGDVHRIKTFVKGYGDAASGFQLVADRIVEASDVLTDRLSPTLRNKIGVFESQTRVHRNWTLRQHSYGNTLGAPYAVGDNDSGVQSTGSFQFGDTRTPSMMNGVHISGSNWQHSHALIFETNLSDLRIRPNVQYELRLRPILKVGTKETSTGSSRVNKARVRFFISGSNINQNLKDFEIPQVSTHPHAVGNMHLLGDPIRNDNGVIALESEDDVDKDTLLDYGVVRIPFTPDFKNDVVVNNDTKLQIAVEAGELFLGRVEVIPATDTNFNPDEFTFVAPMPKLATRPDFFDIAIQFFDRNSNKAKFVPIKQAVKFEGSNEVIQGGDNLLTGSMFIGNTIGQGVEIGGVNSAFIRSVNYHGFTSASMQANGTGSGFMIFSGSVFPNLSGSDNYRGVGIELHDGSGSFLQYRTETGDASGSVFKVQTKDFMFGQSGSGGAFISGSDGNLEISSSNLHISGGNISASQIHIDGGVITGSLVIGDSVTVDAATANQIRVPTGGPPFKAEILSDGYARFSTGSIASFNIDSNAFFTTGSNSFYISGSAAGAPTQAGRQNQFISASKFQVSALGDLTASNVLIDGGTITSDVTVQGTFSANSILTPAGATTQNASASITADGAARFTSASIAGFRISETSISSSNGALVLRDSGQITGSNVDFSGGKIAGWTLSTSSISSNNLIISSSGAIQSANYIPNFRGFNLSTFGNGFLEVEEAKIRGTLKTAVFEKETVNAVGGQLWVANSTTISGSSEAGIGKTITSMSVENVSGFADGEIALIKKVTQTGFSSEYIRINSSSRTFPEDDKNLSGFIFVSRSIDNSVSPIDTDTYHGLGALSSSISELPGTGSSYTDGQVIVSTGRTGSGYIRLNANPNDTFTPYMDIVERTGSSVFDTELKVRIGDLSGLGGKINGASVGGFGLATDNVFLTGSFFVGGINEHISFQTGSFEAKLNKLNLDTPGLKLQGEGSGSSNKILLGLATALGSGDGIFMDGGGDFRAGGASSNFVKFDASEGVLTVSGRINIVGGGGVADTLAEVSHSYGIGSGSLSGSIGAKINPYETQVDLSSTGMSLKNTFGGVISTFGTTAKFFGSASLTDSYGEVEKDGLLIVSGGVTSSFFGTDVIVGRSANDRTALRITDAGALTIGTANTTNFSVAANGDVTMTGTMNITSGDIIDKLDSKISVSGSEASAAFAATGSQAFNSASLAGFKLPLQTQVVLDTSGMALKKDDGTTLADYGIVTELFKNGATDDKAILGGDGLAVVKGGVTASIFGEVLELRSSVIGSQTTASLDSNGLRIMKSGVTQSRFGADTIVGKNATDKTALRITNAGALSIGTSDTTNFSVDASGNVSVAGNITIGSGALKGISTASLAASTASLIASDNQLFTSASQAKESASFAASGSQIKALEAASNTQTSASNDATTKADFAATGSQVFNSSSLAGFKLPLQTQIVLDSGGMSLRKDDGTVLADYGTSVELRANGSTANKTILSATGLAVTQSNTGVANFSSLTTIGELAGQHVEITSSGVTLKSGSTAVGTFGQDITVNNETARGFFNVQSASVNVGRFASASFSPISIEGISASNAIFDRVFTTNVNTSNVQSTGSISLFTSRSFTTSNATSSVPFVVHDEVSGTDVLMEPSFQFSTLYTAKGTDAMEFPSVASGSGTGIFDISTTITSDGQNSAPFRGGAGGDTSAPFNVLGLRVMNDTGDNTGGGGRFQFKGALDSQPYTFINAIDKTRIAPAFRNIGGIRFQVKNSGAIVSLGNITAFGNTSNFTTLSDIKYKKDITRISESLDRVLELKPSKFVWKTTDTEDIGFIAQEVEEIIPEVVLTDKEGILGAPDTKDYKTITYPKLIPLLVDSIQELTKKVSTLEDKIKKLEK